MNKTSIEWALNPDGTQGYTWNPITGCLNGCSYCYARKLANGRLRARYLANKNLAPTMGEGVTPYNTSRLIDSINPFYPREWFNRREKALEGGKAKGVFVCDMSDLFGIGIPESWTECVLETIKVCPEHRFYLLTKQPQNLVKFSPFPPNCWVGVTGTNYQKVTDACGWLDNVEAKVKFISIEPLLSWNEEINTSAIVNWISDINQVIIGAMTCKAGDILHRGSKYPELTPMPYGKIWTLQPKIEWVEEIVRACDKAGIPVFLKDNLKPLLEKENPHECYNGVLGRWQTDGNGGMVFRLRLRQELPPGRI